MHRVPVESSILDSVGYDDEVLEVRFGNGHVYRYFEVPPEVHRRLLEAGSKGSFFNRHVRDDYGYVRVEAAAEPSKL
ncbi:MAG: KTSC domain-containing protein [Solirubrobacterales bacterium]